jgi:hypothetical protein
MLMAIGGQNNASEAPTINRENIFLAIVLDTSPTSLNNWTRMKAIGFEAIDYLKSGDRIEILSAQPGKPRLHRNVTIAPAEIALRQDLRECITGIKQLFFLYQADLPVALAAALDDLGKQCDKYKCWLLVITDGSLTDSQIQQIRVLAAAARASGWFFSITASDTGDRQLFIAGSQGELEILTLRQANLAQMFEKIRPVAVSKPKQEPKIPAPAPQIEVLPPKPAQEIPALRQPESKDKNMAETPPPLEVKRGQPPRTKQTESPQTKIPTDAVNTPEIPGITPKTYLLPVYPVPQEKLPLPVTTGLAPQSKPQTQPQLPDKPKPATTNTRKPSFLLSKKHILALGVCRRT